MIDYQNKLILDGSKVYKTSIEGLNRQSLEDAQSVKKMNELN